MSLLNSNTYACTAVRMDAATSIPMRTRAKTWHSSSTESAPVLMINSWLLINWTLTWWSLDTGPGGLLGYAGIDSAVVSMIANMYVRMYSGERDIFIVTWFMSGWKNMKWFLAEWGEVCQAKSRFFLQNHPMSPISLYSGLTSIDLEMVLGISSDVNRLCKCWAKQRHDTPRESTCATVNTVRIIVLAWASLVHGNMITISNSFVSKTCTRPTHYVLDAKVRCRQCFPWFFWDEKKVVYSESVLKSSPQQINDNEILASMVRDQ